MSIKFDFEKCLKEYGFVVDFENTKCTAKIMGIDYDEENWYDNYYESLEKFAKEKGLNQYIFQADYDLEDSEIFFSKNKETVAKFISNNFFTIDGNSYSMRFINGHTITNRYSCY